jgi:hypothetical protein
LLREATREIRSIRIGGTAMPGTVRIIAIISAAVAAFALAAPACAATAGSRALTAWTSTGIGSGGATTAVGTALPPLSQPAGIGWD